jgi:hypothetical protein
MNDGFTRTPTGVVGSRYFFPKPIVWVEGPTDIYFYEPVVGALNCVIKVFHGSSNAKALIDALVESACEYPYAVILDGDYSILTKRRSRHRWVIVLNRYSFENYLWEKASLNRSCLKHAQCGDGGDVISAEFERVENELIAEMREAIELDIAARWADPAPKVIPDRIEALLKKPDSLDICHAKVATIVRSATAALNIELIRQAKSEVQSFLRTGRISWLLNGHVLFGIIQRVFTQTTTEIRGKKVILNDDALTQLLAEMVWRLNPSAEHRRLRRKLVSVVRELNRAANGA